jgi:hypothetical protein
MTFTRTTDSATLTPIMVFGPYANAVESRNVVRPLLQSSSVRVTYIPQTLRTGELQLLLASYADAVSGIAYFGEASSYQFNGPVTDTTGYSIVGNVIVWNGAIDDTFDLLFAVADGQFRIDQAEADMWTLTVPFKEIQS